MIFRIGRAALIVALCLSLGLHWLALQSVAWTTMLLANARQGSLVEAVAKTFDGAHPCDLCHAVAAGKNSEKKQEAAPAAPKLDLFCPARAVDLPPPAQPYDYAELSVLAPQFFFPPPAPPPRFSSAA